MTESNLPSIVRRLNLAAIRVQAMSGILTNEQPRMASDLTDIAVLLGKAAREISQSK